MARFGAIILAISALLLSSVGLARSAPAGNKPIDRVALFRAVGAMYGLDPALLAAIATAESNNNELAVSPKGAIGLMQLMPATATQFSVADPFDPVDSALGAARFLDYLRRDKECRELPRLIAAYNAGAGAVEHYQGIPPYSETLAYVRRVLWLYLLDSVPPVQRSASQATSVEFSSESVKSHLALNGDQSVLDQLSDIRQERAAAAKAR
jgi:soluble lytic murein transglycosylase-like protein